MEKEIEYKDDDLVYYEGKNCQVIFKYNPTREGIFNIDRSNSKTTKYSITEKGTGDLIQIDNLSHIKIITTNS